MSLSERKERERERKGAERDSEGDATVARIAPRRALAVEEAKRNARVLPRQLSFFSTIRSVKRGWGRERKR